MLTTSVSLLVLLGLLKPSHPFVPRPLRRVSPIRGGGGSAVSMNALLSFTVGVSPVKTEQDLEAASKFFVETFFPLSLDSPPSVKSQLEGDQLRDFLRRYDPYTADTRQGTLLVAREFGRIVGVASVAATPYGKLGTGRGGAGGAVYDPRRGRGAAQAPQKKPSAREVFLGKSRPKQNPCPVLANLSVSPKARRRGIASKLAAKCEAVAKGWGYDEIALAVESTNEPAKRLYRKRGYVSLYENVASTKIEVQDARVRTSRTENDVMAKPLGRQ